MREIAINLPGDGQRIEIALQVGEERSASGLMRKPWPILLMVRALGLGGTERQLTEIAKGLDRSRFTPHVACFQADGYRAEELRAAGIPVIQLPVQSFVHPSALWGAIHLRRYVARNGIELVHTFDVPMNLFGVPAARMAGVPIVLSSQRAQRRLTPVLGQHLLRITDRLVDAIVVNCKAIERELMDQDKVPRSMIQLCYNGIDTEIFRPANSLRPPALQGAGLVVGVLCALRPEKNLETLLEAYARIRHLRMDLKLAIVGSGPSLPHLEKRRQVLGLGEDCIFQPSTRAVADWMRAMDIFVLPSRSEAFSNSLMEAMACGCSVVASDVGGNPELVRHMRTGLLFQSGDSGELARQLALLIENADLRKQLSAAAQELVRGQFSIQQLSLRAGEIYSRLLEQIGV